MNESINARMFLAQSLSLSLLSRFWLSLSLSLSLLSRFWPSLSCSLPCFFYGAKAESENVVRKVHARRRDMLSAVVEAPLLYIQRV